MHLPSLFLMLLSMGSGEYQKFEDCSISNVVMKSFGLF